MEKQVQKIGFVAVCGHHSTIMDKCWHRLRPFGKELDSFPEMFEISRVEFSEVCFSQLEVQQVVDFILPEVSCGLGPFEQ